MLDWIKTKINIWKTGRQMGIGDKPESYKRLSASLLDNMVTFQGKFAGCADFISKEITVCGHRAAVLMIDNLYDKLVLTETLMTPLTQAAPPASVQNNEEAMFTWLRDSVFPAVDQREIFTVEESQWLIMSGFVLLLIDGMDKGLVFGFQSFQFRSVDEPNIDKVMRGSREGFVEPLRINIMLMRRRMKNPDLKFETYMLGNESRTEVAVTYVKGLVSDSVLDNVRHRLKTIDIASLLATGYIQAYFQDQPFSIFSTVGYTERPDTLCGKLSEGRVGILVDGTPMAIFMPYLFIENFHNMDDYAVGHYYATFTRILKFLAYLISVLLPGLYVAVGSFHQSLLPAPLLFTLAQSEQGTPFNLVVEALLMQIIYEILREAGLRAPKQIGSSLNIVGAFLIGQAAVSAGLIGAPMVIIVALTATTSLVVPTLYEPGVVMRFSFILLAGIAGLYGVVLAIAFFSYQICSMKTYEVPFTSPITPFEAYTMRDMLVRAPWKILARKKVRVQDLPGSNAER